MPDKNTFAKNLRSLMENRKISQRALASHIGVSYQAVSLWCAGKNYPECDMLLKIAEFFGVSTDYLLTGINPDLFSSFDTSALSEEARAQLKILCSDKEYAGLIEGILKRLHSHIMNTLTNSYRLELKNTVAKFMNTIVASLFRIVTSDKPKEIFDKYIEQSLRALDILYDEKQAPAFDEEAGDK